MQDEYVAGQEQLELYKAGGRNTSYVYLFDQKIVAAGGLKS